MKSKVKTIETGCAHQFARVVDTKNNFNEKFAYVYGYCGGNELYIHNEEELEGLIELLKKVQKEFK